MPELPEVETVARDLRPLIAGATIVDARRSGRGRCAAITPEAFADGVAGRRIEAVGRRGEAARDRAVRRRVLTIHLKMTGQLFVVPQGGPRTRTSASSSSSRTAASSASGTSASSAGSGCTARGPTSRSVRERSGPEPLDRRLHASRAFRRRLRAPEGPPQAAPARPVVPRRASATSTPTRRSGGAPPSAADGPDAAPARRAPPLTERPADPRRGGRSARLVDRRLHGARRRRRDAGAPRGLPAHRRAVPRCGRPIRRIVVGGPVDALLLVVPAAAGGRSGGRAGDPRDDVRAASGRGPALDGAAGRGGERRAGADADARAGAARRGRSGRGGPRRPGARRPAPRSAAEPMSILRLERRPPRDRHVRHPRRHHGGDRARRPDRARRARTAPARRRCSGSPPAATSPTAARSSASAG